MGIWEIIGAIAAGVALLGPVAWFIVRDWYNKSKELEETKAQNTNKALTRLQNEVVNFRSCITDIKVKIATLEANMAVNKSTMKELQDQLKSTAKMVDEYSKNFDQKIGNRIKTELVELSKRATLVRGKKNDGE